MDIEILHMETVAELKKTLEGLIESGNEITCVTNLRELNTPNMDGVVISDWLIIYKAVS